MTGKYHGTRKKALQMTVAFTLAVAFSVSVASAYNVCGNKLKGSWEDEYYYVSDRTEGYGSLVDDAVAAWNDAIDSTSSSSLDIDLTETSNGSARTTRVVISPLDRGPDGYWGYTYYYDVNIFGEWEVLNYGGYPGQNYQAGSAVINKHYTDSASDARTQNVIMHEMGHIFGLMHSDYDTESSSLMWEDIVSRTKLVEPQADDIRGVRSIYD